MATLKDESVIRLRVILGYIVREGRKHVSERVAETGVADEHVLRIVWKVVIGDIKDGNFFTNETGHVVGRLERNLTYAERNDFEVMAVDYADLTGVAFQDALVDETFRVRTLGGMIGGRCDCRAITDVEFVEICQALDKGWRWVAGHEERGIVVWVADGDVAETVDDLIVIKDVVCCNECGQELSEVDGYHLGGWGGWQF